MSDYGVLRAVSNAQLTANENKAAAQARAAAEAANSPVVTGLTSYLLRLWSDAKIAKFRVEPALRMSLRQRRGEYEADKLVDIKATGGSEIYMMLTSLKCRAAASWLRDTMMGIGENKPYSIAPTPIPEVPGDSMSELYAAVGQEVGQMAAQGTMPPPEAVRMRLEKAKEVLQRKLKEQARKKAELTEQKIDDVLQEGHMLDALDAFIEDFVTYKAAILKGPIPRMEAVMKWEKGTEGGWQANVTQTVKEVFERVDPFKVYPAPWAADINDGYLFEFHQLTRGELYNMIGVTGYNEEAIRKVLREYNMGTLNDWTGVALHGADHINQPNNGMSEGGLIQALEFWGSVPGKTLVEWGMSEAEVPDLEKEYNVNAWLIHNEVIKAVINTDPMGGKPYSKACYETVPGAFWGNSIPDLIRHLQDVCNAAARSLVNNMAIASGPMMWANIDRLPLGAKITKLRPWKIFQTVSDPMGATTPPMDFFQPASNANELMQVFQFFSAAADEYSGLPRYVTGNENVGGAARTASGLQMLMGNASKLMKQVISSIDKVYGNTISRTHIYLLRYKPEMDLEGDVRILTLGANAVAAKEALHLRRNEFLAMTANPVDQQLMGPKGRAVLLRENAKGLGVNPDDIIPDPENASSAALENAGVPTGGISPQGMGTPANMGARPDGAFMDRMSVG